MSELEQLRQEAEQLKNQIRVCLYDSINIKLYNSIDNIYMINLINYFINLL